MSSFIVTLVGAVSLLMASTIVALATAVRYRRMVNRHRDEHLALEHATSLLGDRAARLLRVEADRFQREVDGDPTAATERFDSVAAIVGLRRQLDPDLAMAERDTLGLIAGDRDATRACRAADEVGSADSAEAVAEKRARWAAMIDAFEGGDEQAEPVTTVLGRIPVVAQDLTDPGEDPRLPLRVEVHQRPGEAPQLVLSPDGWCECATVDLDGARIAWDLLARAVTLMEPTDGRVVAAIGGAR